MPFVGGCEEVVESVLKRRTRTFGVGLAADRLVLGHLVDVSFS